MSWRLGISFFLLGLLGGCSSTLRQEEAKLRVIHASYDAPFLDVKCGESVFFLDLFYPKSSDYLAITAGKQKAIVHRKGDPTAKLLEKEISLEKDTQYTLFLFDTASKLEASVQSDPPVLDAGKATLRFLHASPDAPTLDLKAKTPSPLTLFEAVKFKSLSPYKTIEEGDYVLTVAEAGLPAVAAEFEPMKLEKGKVYTFIAQGTFSSTDQIPFSLHILIDAGDGKGGKSALYRTK